MAAPSREQSRICGTTRPCDEAVASYKPLPSEFAEALWGRYQPVVRYDILPPPGMHLECPTVNPPTS